MKKILKLFITTLVILAILMFGGWMSAPISETTTNHLERMIIAAVAGDYENGRAAEAARNEKIEKLKLDYIPIVFDELMLLSKIMYAEAGSAWLSDEWKMCVGEVVLNRVDSPEFPDTIAEVLAQPGQYYGANSRYFNRLLPSEICVRLATRLLEGERVLNDPAVVFQANFKQGSGTHSAYYDKHLGWTYFCISSMPELYQENSSTKLTSLEEYEILGMLEKE